MRAQKEKRGEWGWRKKKNQKCFWLETKRKRGKKFQQKPEDDRPATTELCTAHGGRAGGRPEDPQAWCSPQGRPPRALALRFPVSSTDWGGGLLPTPSPLGVPAHAGQQGLGAPTPPHPWTAPLPGKAPAACASRSRGPASRSPTTAP